MSPELCMVVEDENGIVGYAMAALNVKSHNQKMAVSWIPELRMKYPLDNSINELPQNVQVSEYDFLYIFVFLYILCTIFVLTIFKLKFTQDAIQYFHSFIPDVTEQLCRQHPSKLICAVLPSVTDQSICKRLITCILAALRANGTSSLLKHNKIYLLIKHILLFLNTMSLYGVTCFRFFWSTYNTVVNG